MSTILERIEQVAEFEGIKIGALEKKIGASKGVLSRAIAKNTDIQTKWIGKIIENYPIIDANWLLTGYGSMTKKRKAHEMHDDTPIKPFENPENQRKDNENNAMYSKKGIPLIPIEALAGLPVSDNTGVTFIDCEHYIIPEFQKKGVEFMIRVSGSSMYPKYSNGDILACRRVHDILFFQWGKVYVIDSSQGALVKRVFKDESQDNILLVSDNMEKYPPFSFPKSDIRSLSIVLGVVRLE